MASSHNYAEGLVQTSGNSHITLFAIGLDAELSKISFSPFYSVGCSAVEVKVSRENCFWLECSVLVSQCCVLLVPEAGYYL